MARDRPLEGLQHVQAPLLHILVGQRFFGVAQIAGSSLEDDCDFIDILAPALTHIMAVA
jgi:hypothetical protein